MFVRFVSRATQTNGEASVMLHSFRSYVLIFVALLAMFPTMLWFIVAILGFIDIANLAFPFFIFLHSLCRGSSDFPLLRELSAETLNTALTLMMALMLSGSSLVPIAFPFDALAFSFVIG
jgi:hypothetical protein